MSEIALPFTLVLAVIGGFSLLGKSGSKYNISPPMIFITSGIIAGSLFDYFGENIIQNNDMKEFILLLAEVTLIFVLFHDASTVNFKELYVNLPLRLLLIGLPMTLVTLFFIVQALFPGVGFSGALLIAAALTPTDAGLGAPTILNPKVPSMIRQALNVESGINDGLITPVVLIALSGLVGEESSGSVAEAIPSVAVIPICIALGLALFITPFFSLALDYSAELNFSTHTGREIAVVMLPLLMWSLSVLTGGNSFIAGFLSGGFFGYFSKQHNKDQMLVDLLESVTDFFSYLAWIFAGVFFFEAFKKSFHWEWVLIAFLALIPLRMIPVYISLFGSDLDVVSMSFLGWFGPRGLATVIFALLVEEDIEDENMRVEIIGVLLLTVLVSVFAHGFTSAPFADEYSIYVQNRSKISPSIASKMALLQPEISEFRTRGKSSSVSRQFGAQMNYERQHIDLPYKRRTSDVNVEELKTCTENQGTPTSLEVNISSTEDIISLPYTKCTNTTALERMSSREDYSEVDAILEERKSGRKSDSKQNLKNIEEENKNTED